MPHGPIPLPFVQDALRYMQSDSDNMIEGLYLPNSSILSESFVDDSTIFLRETKENLKHAFKVLNQFCTGSKAKINVSESTTMWCSPLLRTWLFGDDCRLKWLLVGSTTTNLGFPIGYKMTQDKNNAKVLLQIQNKLAKCNHQKLSMAARIQVSNQVILAVIWYFASGADLSRSVLQKSMFHGEELP